MQAKNCDEYLTHETVEEAFKKRIAALTDQIIRCLYKCCYNGFTRHTIIRYSGYAYDSVEDMADRSFTDAILAFREYTAVKGLRRNAKIKSIFQQFYTYTFHNNFRSDVKVPGGIGSKEPGERLIDELPEEEENLFKKENLACLQEVLKELDEEDVKILYWYYKKRWSMKDIAEELDMIPASVTNRFYRLRNRLEKMIEQCKQR